MFKINKDVRPVIGLLVDDGRPTSDIGCLVIFAPQTQVTIVSCGDCWGGKFLAVGKAEREILAALTRDREPWWWWVALEDLNPEGGRATEAIRRAANAPVGWPRSFSMKAKLASA